MKDEKELINLDSFFMSKAIIQAKMAFQKKEVPIGAIVVDEKNQIIGSGFNKMESKKCQSFHAEIMAIQEACRQKNDWRLSGCTIYTSLEPCLMCFGLIKQSRIARLVFAAKSPLYGFEKYLNELIFKEIDLKIDSGLKENDSLDIIKSFFKKARTLEKD